MIDSDVQQSRLPVPVGSCDITVVILTFNEARHIERAIASVRSFARDILVVDSFSTDNTVALVEAAGVRVLQHPFVTQARQFNWALDHGAIATGWIMRLDADEVIEPDLAEAIKARLPVLPADIVGLRLKRKHIFLGRWVRHGGRYPLELTRLWRTGQGRVEDRWMDEHVVVWGGGIEVIEGGFADDNLNDLTYFVDKHNKYATREAIEVLSRKYALLPDDHRLAAQTVSGQAKLKRLIKERVYNRLPLWVGPTAYFLYRVVVQGGVLDGRSGMIYHVLQGFWYRYLVNAKIFEFEREMADCTTADERRVRLGRLTGYDLTPVAVEQ